MKDQGSEDEHEENDIEFEDNVHGGGILPAGRAHEAWKEVGCMQNQQKRGIWTLWTNKECWGVTGRAPI